MALISGITDKMLPDTMIAFGELGLAGEVRAVSQTEYRVKEAVRLGFTEILLPGRSVTERLSVPKGVRLIGVSSILGALPLLGRNEQEDPSL
jgi:DNA repair protein RadA/Sms